MLNGRPTRQVYGGVRRDITYGQIYLSQAMNEPSDQFYGPAARLDELTIAIWCLTADLPLSAVGDTLMLPWTVWIAFKRPVQSPELNQQSNVGW
jgi:uncharacterized protein YceK